MIKNNKQQTSNVKYEAALIGLIIIDELLMDDVASVVSSGDFCSEKYRTVFGLLESMREDGKTIDTLSVEDELKAKGLYQDYGGSRFVDDLVDAGMSRLTAPECAERIADLANVRRIRHAARLILDTPHDEVGDYPNYAQEQIQAAIKNTGGAKTEQLKDAMKKLINDIAEGYDNRMDGKLSCLSTGYDDLDKILRISPSDLIILAARPSMGKSAMAMNLIENVCVESDSAGLFFSVEMSTLSICRRMMARGARIKMDDLSNYDMNDSKFVRVAKSTRKFNDMHLYINDSPGLGLSEIRAASRQLKSKLDKQGVQLKMIGLDYLQLCKTKSGHSREREVAELSAGLKQLAREIDVPILCLSQLSRAVERRDDKRPVLSDLRDSGSIEQDADIVLFLYRDDYYNEHSEDRGVAEVLIRKQRNGPTSVVKLKYFPEFCSFENLSKNSY